MSSRTSLLIVAAGTGQRAGGPIPKQYQKLAGEAVLYHSVMAFLEPKRLVENVQIVIHPDHKGLFDLSFPEKLDWLLPPVFGADTRQTSVWAGLQALQPHQPDNILIHDAARPFVSQKTIEAVNEILNKKIARAVLPVTPVTDTIKQVKNDQVECTVDRSALFAAQTPQGFSFDLICDLHRQAEVEDEISFTDDISLAEWKKEKVVTVDGSPENIKITTANDLVYAQHFWTLNRENDS